MRSKTGGAGNSKLNKVVKKEKSYTRASTIHQQQGFNPRIEYRLRYHIVSKWVCDRLHRPWLMLIKNKAGLASSTANGILHHRNLVGLRTIWQARLTQQIPSLIERLNNTGTVGSVT